MTYKTLREASGITKEEPYNEVVQFVDLVEADGRASHISMSDKNPGWLAHAGGLEHQSPFRPATKKDAKMLIEFIQKLMRDLP